MDTLIAAHAAGPAGRVVGLDISAAECVAAEKLRDTRGIADEQLTFVVGDMENIPALDGEFDVVLSNGGFCLVPDKSLLTNHSTSPCTNNGPVLPYIRRGRCSRAHKARRIS